MQKVIVHPRSEKDHPVQLDIEDLIKLAGWDPKDPGVGRAVIAEDGREILNPAKFEEPADIEEGQDMMMVLEQRIMKKLRAGLFTGEEEVDETVDEALDFNIDDDVQYVSGYEVTMQDEFPNFPTPEPRANEAVVVPPNGGSTSSDLDNAGTSSSNEPLPRAAPAPVAPSATRSPSDR